MSRRQGKRTSQRDFEQRIIAGERCTHCGKIRFLTKGDAKKVLRRMKHRKGRMHAYPCTAPGDDMPTFWHIGHVPRDLVRGVITRDDVEARRYAS